MHERPMLAAFLAGVLVGVSNPAISQSPAQAPVAAPQSASAVSPVPDPANSNTADPNRKVYTVPAGTKVLLQLRSSVNTKSAKPGDGVYLASTFPVVVGNRVMIPAGVYVQGVVD